MNKPQTMLPWISPPPGGHQRLLNSLDEDSNIMSPTGPSMILAPVISFVAVLVFAIAWLPDQQRSTHLDKQTAENIEARPSSESQTNDHTAMALLAESESGVRLYVAFVDIE